MCEYITIVRVTCKYLEGKPAHSIVAHVVFIAPVFSATFGCVEKLLENTRYIYIVNHQQSIQ